MSNNPTITETYISSKTHAQLGLCPFCYNTRNYIVHILEEWVYDDGEEDSEEFWQPVCGDCEARGSLCGDLEYAIENWNDISLAVYPKQTTRWPGSKMCEVRGSKEREEK